MCTTMCLTMWSHLCLSPTCLSRRHGGCLVSDRFRVVTQCVLPHVIDLSCAMPCVWPSSRVHLICSWRTVFTALAHVGTAVAAKFWMCIGVAPVTCLPCLLAHLSLFTLFPSFNLFPLTTRLADTAVGAKSSLLEAPEFTAAKCT
jgi:hypothetical protein